MRIHIDVITPTSMILIAHTWNYWTWWSQRAFSYGQADHWFQVVFPCVWASPSLTHAYLMWCEHRQVGSFPGYSSQVDLECSRQFLAGSGWTAPWSCYCLLHAWQWGAMLPNNWISIMHSLYIEYSFYLLGSKTFFWCLYCILLWFYL